VSAPSTNASTNPAVWIGEDQQTLLGLLDRRLESDPDGRYMDVVGAAFSAADVYDTACRLSSSLAGLGIEPGDRVATLCENSPEAFLAWWGIIAAGGVAVPINSAYKGDYLIHQLSDAGAKALIVQDELGERAAQIAADVATLDHVVVAGADDLAVAGATSHRWDDLLATAPGEPHRDRAPSDLATFIYTGGTTGPSKGCMLSQNYHVAASRQISACWSRTADDVVWTALPLFHYNALVTAVLGALDIGGSAAIARRFSVSGFWTEINRVGATVVSMLGTMAYLLANDEQRPEMPQSGAPEANTTLRLIGAAPMPVEIDTKLRERFGVATFSGAFGVTEASLISWSPDQLPARPNAAGVLNDEYFDVRIFDDDDHELPANTDGEIVIRPKRPHVMFEGYWGRPDATVDTSRNWWYHTGDIGRVDDDRYLYFVDRKADYLRRRGENISSFEVEKIMLKHAAINDVAVHAVPSELTEDDLKVTAILVSGASVTEEELFRWCIAELPYFALPRYVEFRAELPRSPVGRVLKRELRDEGVTAATWDVEQSGITYDKK
jgi:crotonobetaine/carnitine-CoA ligase